MRGVRLFGRAFASRPFSTLTRLLLDYLTYVGMCIFCLFLLTGKRPLAWWDRRGGDMRRRLIEATARLARA